MRALLGTLCIWVPLLFPSVLAAHTPVTDRRVVRGQCVQWEQQGQEPVPLQLLLLLSLLGADVGAHGLDACLGAGWLEPQGWVRGGGRAAV